MEIHIEQFEKGVEYKIIASNVNDYEFADTSVI